jgi:glycosyltransferase involved in cell wall biosynthesis
MDRKISLAIPYYNNSNFILEAISPALTDDRVSEIIICDDFSSDINSLIKIIMNINSKKIVFFRNNENKGCYENKIETVSKCTNEWAILLDSDNVLSESYIDKLFEIPVWDETVIYAPSNAITFPEYPPSPSLNFAKYENTLITREVYKNEFESINFKCLINDCNYFLPVKSYLKCMKPLQYLFDRKRMDCQDSAILFTDWICNNNTVYVVKDLHYKHRLHPNSNYVLSKSHEYEHEILQQQLNKILYC